MRDEPLRQALRFLLVQWEIDIIESGDKGKEDGNCPWTRGHCDATRKHIEEVERELNR